MIKITEIAEFNQLNCPLDRNREIISSKLNPSKFKIIALSNKINPLENIETIHTESGKLNKIKSYIKISLKSSDILHTRPWLECIPIFFLWKLRNPKGKHVLTIHGITKNKYNHFAGKILTKLAHKVTSVSETTKKEVKNTYNIDSIVIYNGIDTKKFKPTNNKEEKSEKLNILYVGRFVAHKNPMYVIKAAEMLGSCNFYLYGKGPLRNELESAAKKLNNVHIQGEVPHSTISKIYQRCDIFLFPTEHEGFANVVLEAAASGLPIVGLNRTSMTEFVKHGDNGLLADGLEEMIEYLQFIIDNDDVHQSMSINARESSLYFDWDYITKQYAEFYEKLAMNKF